MDSFWSRVRKTSSCWLWIGGISGNGYGKCPMGKRGESKLAHRVSYELHIGHIPDGLLVCHKCDNPPCVNPGHLFLGTQRDNLADMYDKGRQATPYGRHGERNPKASMTREIADEIRKLYWVDRIIPKQKTAPYTSKLLAEIFGVSRMAVRLIACGRSWK